MKLFICDQTNDRIFGQPVELKNFDFPWEKDIGQLSQDKHFVNSQELMKWFITKMEEGGFEIKFVGKKV